MRRTLAALLASVLAPCLALFAASFAIEPPRLDLEGGALVLDRAGEPLFAGRAPSDVRCYPVALARVSPWLARAVVAVEDERFFDHGGVDPLAVLRAAVQDLGAGRIVSGASTLEMQVARLCGGLERSFSGKLRQAATALALARRHTKAEILGAWLNRASFGGDLVGCEAAARRWFGKSSAALELHEAALLAGLPQAPERLRPDRHPEAARKRRDHVLRRLRALGWIDAARAARALARPLDLAPSSWPRSAPHLAQRLAAENGVSGALALTLDGALQRAVERELASALPAVRARGASGIAALVVETASGEVRAWCGSVEPLASRPGAQVDLARARRGAGSTLKPFLFARALELGLCAPDELLEDQPRRYAEYLPRNFDGTFGPAVPALEALARSRNLPALELLDRIGVRDLAELLVRCGLAEDLESLASHGLPLALGTCEMRLADLVSAYAALGRGGLYAPLRWERGRTRPEPARVLDADATALVLQALADERTSPLAELGHARSGYAVKTGTSSGGRDAWCLATSSAWTIGVWAGNLDGAPAPELSGRSVAVPVLARLVALLPPAVPFPVREGAREAIERRCAARAENLPLRAAGPRLLGPVEGAIYTASSAEEAVRVRCIARVPEAAALQWWLDGAPLEPRGAELVLELRAGRHRVRVVDAEGRFAEAGFRVEAPRTRRSPP